jgi:hypothetical protein
MSSCGEGAREPQLLDRVDREILHQPSSAEDDLSRESRTDLDAIVFVQSSPDQLPADIDPLLFVLDDAIENLEEFDNATTNAESGVLRKHRVRTSRQGAERTYGDPLADLREVLNGEIGTTNDVLADEFDRSVTHRRRAIVHSVLDALAHTRLSGRRRLATRSQEERLATYLMEELRVLSDDETDVAQGLRPERDS